MSKIAFLFPGQGAQAVGMGKSLAESWPEARRLYDRAGQLLGYDLAQLCFEGPAAQLDSTVHSQPALLVTSLAALEVLRQKSPEVVESCAGAAGLSLGEYTAMVFAGVMDFESALAVVQQRGRAMQDAADANPSGMVSVLGLDADRVRQLCDQTRREDQVLQVANLLCPGNVVVSGSTEACEQLASAALQAGAIKVVPLAVAGAFHTPLMQSAVDRLAAALSDVRLSRPRIPVFSNVDAQAHDDPEEIRRLLIQQVVSPVLWEDSVRRMLDSGLDVYYEVGPGKVLRGLLRRIERNATCHSTME